MDSKEVQLIEGVIEFTSPIHFHWGVSGSVFEVAFGGSIALILFPKLLEEEKKFLVVPDSNSIHANVDYWGSVMSSHDKHIKLEKILIQIKASKENYLNVGDEVYKSLNSWKRKFEEYIEINTKQVIEKKIVNTHDMSRGEFKLSTLIESVNKRAFTKTDPIKVTMQEVILADIHIVKKAIHFASSNNEVLLSYSLIKKANRELDNLEYRTAIIDATTSCDVALYQNLSVKLRDNISEELAKDLIDRKYLMTSERIKLGRILKLIPDLDYVNKLLRPRNKAAHKGYLSDPKEAMEAVKIAEKLVNHFYDNVYE